MFKLKNKLTQTGTLSTYFFLLKLQVEKEVQNKEEDIFSFLYEEEKRKPAPQKKRSTGK